MKKKMNNLIILKLKPTDQEKIFPTHITDK